MRPTAEPLKRRVDEPVEDKGPPERFIRKLILYGLLMKKTILAITLIGLFVVTALFGFAFRYASANTPESITYYFNPALETGSLFVSCTGVGTLSLTPPSIGPAVVLVGGYCPDAPMSTVYSGVSFTVTSVTYSLFVSCESQSEGEFFEVGVVGPIGSVPGSPIQDCSMDSPEHILVTITPGPGTQLSNGETLTSDVGFGELPQSTCIMCGENFSGTVTISGYTVSPVPEFPLGLIALLVVALPMIIVLRAKYSGKLLGQS